MQQIPSHSNTDTNWSHISQDHDCQSLADIRNSTIDIKSKGLVVGELEVSFKSKYDVFLY